MCKEKKSMIEQAQIEKYLQDAEFNAIKSIARGKWSLFGYWAAQSVHLRRILGITSSASPFRPLKDLAVRMVELKDCKANSIWS